MVVLRVLRLLCGKGVFCSSVSVGLPARFWLRRQETEMCEIKARHIYCPGASPTGAVVVIG